MSTNKCSIAIAFKITYFLLRVTINKRQKLTVLKMKNIDKTRRLVSK